jgi:hypothetical protein
MPVGWEVGELWRQRIRIRLPAARPKYTQKYQSSIKREGISNYWQLFSMVARHTIHCVTGCVFRQAQVHALKRLVLD